MAYEPIKQWIALGSESPTAATTNLYNALVDAGASPVNLGQGREIGELELLAEETAKELAIDDRVINSRYNLAKLVSDLSDAAAGWMDRILGIGTSKETTFVLETLGRTGLDEGIHIMAKEAGFPADGVFIIPDTSWPMVGDLLGDYNLKPAFYAMERRRYAENIRAQLEQHGDKVVGVYINSPHNPTGQILGFDDFAEIFDVLNEYNSGEHLARRGGRKIGIVMDAPYLHACKQKNIQGVRYLDAEMESFGKQQEITPWIVAISMSKFFGTATPGFTMIAAHKDYAKKLSSRLTRTTGLSFIPQFFKALITVLSPANDEAVLNHAGNLAEKYTQNRMTLERAFGDSVVDGDPGMTALIKLDPANLLGRTMQKHDGSDFTIDAASHVVEYLLNKHGVATVSNGTDKEGALLLRLAAAAKPENYAEGISRLQTGLEEIRVTPPDPGASIAIDQAGKASVHRLG